VGGGGGGGGGGGWGGSGGGVRGGGGGGGGPRRSLRYRGRLPAQRRPLVEGGVFVWAGGVKATPRWWPIRGCRPAKTAASRSTVPARAGPPDIYAAVDLSRVVDPTRALAAPAGAGRAGRALRLARTWTLSCGAGRWSVHLPRQGVRSSRSAPAAGRRLAGITSGGLLAPAQRLPIVWEYRHPSATARLGPGSPVMRANQRV